MQDLKELEEFLNNLKNNQSLYSDKKYYSSMITLANMIRQKYRVEDSNMGLRLIRNIYKHEGIRIDTARRRLKKVRGAYFCEDGDCSVLISPALPPEPRLFTLAHELKHHYVDQDLLAISCLDVTQRSDRREIGAEVFAAELILPVSEFNLCLQKMGIEHGKCSPENVCRLKHEFNMKLSYQSICKRLYIERIVAWGSFDKIKFTKLNEQIYGVPFYKRRKI